MNFLIHKFDFDVMLRPYFVTRFLPYLVIDPPRCYRAQNMITDRFRYGSQSNYSLNIISINY